MGIEQLVGKTLNKIVVDDAEIYFYAGDETYKMYHQQDCCERVRIEDICGDIQALVGKEILGAWEESNRAFGGGGSCTWTFYNIRTILDTVTIRWLGESNGYYSESVDFEKI